MPTISGDQPAVPVTALREGVLASNFGNSAEWRRSSRCEGGACIEAAAQDDAVLLRSSDDPDGSILAFAHATWRDLTARIKQMPPTEG
jgi:hypothetical protein